MAKRKRVSKKKSKNPTWPLVVGGACFLGILFYVMRSSKDQSLSLSATSQPTPVEGKHQPIQALSSRADNFDPERSQVELNRQRARLAAASKLGLKTLKAKGSGPLSIPLEFRPQKIWCQGGDLDTMRYAASDLSAKEFLISLEPLGQGTESPGVPVSLDQLFQGVQHTFNLPRPKEKLSYGLFICADRKKAGRCGEKSVKTHAEISRTLAAKALTEAPEDYVYYFQHLLIGPQGIETYKADRIDAEYESQVHGYLKKQHTFSEAEVQAAWRFNKALRSTPADIQGGSIVLTLPHNDPRCLQAAQ